MLQQLCNSVGRRHASRGKKTKITKNEYIFWHISSSYAKILGETNFQPWEIPRSGSKAKDGKERENKKRDQKLVITMASYALQRHLGGARKAAWANYFIKI